jgi:hypothetical protein
MTWRLLWNLLPSILTAGVIFSMGYFAGYQQASLEAERARVVAVDVPKRPDVAKPAAPSAPIGPKTAPQKRQPTA